MIYKIVQKRLTHIKGKAVITRHKRTFLRNSSHTLLGTLLTEQIRVTVDYTTLVFSDAGNGGVLAVRNK